MRKTLIAVALALTFAPAVAQGPGSGPGMGPGMMGGGYGMMGLAALDLSDAQAEKIFGIQEGARKKNADVMSKARAEMFKTQLDARRQIEAVLTPEQRKQWRARGPRWRDEE